MKENKYDDEMFFSRYSQMTRSVEGLKGAGEWHEFKKLLPDLTGKRVLDLGCGFGWHCLYAAEQGADEIVGIDISGKMLERAKSMTASPRVRYERMAIEDIDFEAGFFDVVISSLALHYVESFGDICGRVGRCLAPGGYFVFSVEHPIFTAEGRQDWFYDGDTRLHWPVDRYFTEGRREAVFLGEDIVKYHRTLTTYLDGLIKCGFEITGIVEPRPDEAMMQRSADMADELRRPMMLLVSSRKKAGALIYSGEAL